MKKKEEEDIEKKPYIRQQTCRNCGINGHLYKDCIHPVMSFGIICYMIEEDKSIKYLMIQRKDSLSFMEFIRGKYNISDTNYIKQLLLSMTSNEKKLILNKCFDEIWIYAWFQNNISNIKQTTEYIDSKNKFDFLTSNKLLKKMIDYSKIIDKEQEWGFPKGRRKLKEKDYDCAIREFCEETLLNPSDIEINNQIEPFEEIFFGTNNILYKHTYYIAKIKDNNVSIAIDTNCIEQIREIRALKWFTYQDTLKHINTHNVERYNIVEKVHDIITSDIL